MTRIKSININKMGCFDGFEWSSLEDDDKGNPTEFKYLNVIYGRNYSGKTTISKIIRSLETKVPPENFDLHDYEVQAGNDTYNAENLETSNLDVRVYNKDFVDAHLGFLRDQNNDVTPFAIVGGVNVEVTTKIDDAQESLGSDDKADTLFGKLKIANDSEKITIQEHKDIAKALDKKLRSKAVDTDHGIKYNSIYGDATYNITRIKQDLDKVGANLNQYALDAEKADQLSKVAQEAPLAEIDEFEIYISSLKEKSETTKLLVEKKIQTSESIQELLDDALLQAWVKEGRKLHEGKRKKCAFCKNDLPKELWSDLDAHFNKESQDLEKQILDEIAKLKELKLSVDKFDLPKEGDFYESQKAGFSSTLIEIKESVKSYNLNVDALISQLELRKKSIFDQLEFNELVLESENLNTLIDNLNTVIKSNNAHTDSIDQSKRKAKIALILNEVASFHKDIDYKKCVDDVEEKDKAMKGAGIITIQAQKAVTDEQKVLEALKVLLKDETKGADKVNEYLSHHFGHSGIRLDAEENDDGEHKKFRFCIKRGDALAHNLSEGECSIIAFCYFMAKLEEPETQGKKLIIYIDDPISSLDSNHIFFIYSLISSRIVGSTGKDPATGQRIFHHHQIFISTHNLDFLKYLKQLENPNKQREYFLIERESDKKSTLKRMPNYLRHYATEFNYLFEQIVKCANAKQTDPHEIFYNFGNNLRKFFEAYLYYKYPSHEHNNERLKRFFGNDLEAGLVAGRITNELSHLEDIFDRSMKPIEVPEIPKLANYVLDKMFEKDPDQFNALARSVGISERLVVTS